MNCEGVRQIIKKSLSTTTVAERNAACLHMRTCKECRSMVFKKVSEIPREQVLRNTAAAMAAWKKDAADPEWK